MKRTKTRIILTGASGFVGRNLLEDLKEDYRIFAIARRSQQECNAPVHPNIAWIRADISDKNSITGAFREVQTAGGADYVFHLAAFYEFFGEDHPEYHSTNVIGTSYILELCKELDLKLFVFASSVAACSFPPENGTINESSSADGNHIYAVSKRLGEELVQKYAQDHPACIVRFGAIYSDWCEYPPLYTFLTTWLGSSWKHKILAGKGKSAIPYIHIRDIILFIHKLMENTSQLESGQILIASTAGATTHEQLFRSATRSFFGVERKPFHMPKLICALGLFVMSFYGKLTGKLIFERPWMRHYIDLKLTVDNSETCHNLKWSPNQRNLIETRMPFLVERMKSEPYAWRIRNMTAMRRLAPRIDFNIYSTLAEAESEIIDRFVSRIEKLPDLYEHHGISVQDSPELLGFYKLIFRLILTSIHSNNKLLIQNYFEISGISPFEAGCTAEELGTLLQVFNEIITGYLNEAPQLKEFRDRFYDYISMPIMFGIDEIEYQYTVFKQRGPTRESPDQPDAAAVEPNARELLEETIWNCLVHRR